MKRNVINRTLLACLLLTSVVAASILPAAAIRKRAVSYTEDFSSDGFADGTDVYYGSPLNDFWDVNQFVNADHSVTETDEDGLRSLHVRGYLGMLSTSAMFETYTYTVTMRVPDANTGSFAVTARHAGENVHGPLFEADHYKENNPGLKNMNEVDRPGFLQDFSGFSIYPTGKKNGSGQSLMTLNLKTFVDDGHFRVANAYYDLWIDTDLTEYFTLRFEDDGKKIDVFLNDVPLCTVEMSDPGVYPGDATDAETYYRHAVVTLADGTAAMDIDNARLAVEARAAFSARCGEAYVRALTVYSENTEVETDPPAPDTQPVTEPHTEAPTDPETVPVTQPDTVPSTEPATEPATEPETAHAPDTRIDYILTAVFLALESGLLTAISLLIAKKKQ